MTYRSRLLLHVGMMVLLLVGMTGFTFNAARDVIVAGTEARLRHIGLHQEANVRTQADELDRYARIMAGDQHLQEYLYALLERRSGVEEREPYHDRRGVDLPVDYRVVVSRDGEVLLGEGFPRLIEEVQRRAAPGESEPFFFEAQQGVVMVAARPLGYRGERLATIVVARVLDDAWLNEQEHRSRDYLLFFERDGRVIQGSTAGYEGQRIDPQERRLDYGDDRFRIREVSYGSHRQGLPGLWYGVADSDLDQMLADYQRRVYTFAALGSLVVLLVGGLMLRNFSKPMRALMATTEKMINGELPVMARSECTTEMGKLVNRFADVLDALRREQSKLECMNRKLQETAITDSLTGLYNRRYLQEVAPGLFAQVVRDKRYLTAVLLDLDYFKAINDSWGHLGGDAVLVHFARLLKHNSRANDFLFRIGGEEFIILNVAEDPHDSVTLANKVRKLVEKSPATYQGKTLPITVSAGISCCYGKSGDASLSTLMRAADLALYEAKSSGRNRVVLHSSCLEATSSATRRARITLIEGGVRSRGDS